MAEMMQIVSRNEARRRIACQLKHSKKQDEAGYTKQYMDSIRTKLRGYNRQYYHDNKDRRSEENKKWHKENRARSRAKCARRRGFQSRATPPWASLQAIIQIYELCPEGFEVDHDIPLISGVVCGLHVENNLTYLTKSENCSKKNKFTPTGVAKMSGEG